jgi:hypothetical protein
MKVKGNRHEMFLYYPIALIKGFNPNCAELSPKSSSACPFANF